jgi:hypothetical protein
VFGEIIDHIDEVHSFNTEKDGIKKSDNSTKRASRRTLSSTNEDVFKQTTADRLISRHHLTVDIVAIDAVLRTTVAAGTISASRHVGVFEQKNIRRDGGLAQASQRGRTGKSAVQDVSPAAVSLLPAAVADTQRYESVADAVASRLRFRLSVLRAAHQPRHRRLLLVQTGDARRRISGDETHRRRRTTRVQVPASHNGQVLAAASAGHQIPAAPFVPASLPRNEIPGGAESDAVVRHADVVLQTAVAVGKSVVVVRLRAVVAIELDNVGDPGAERTVGEVSVSRVS